MVRGRLIKTPAEIEIIARAGAILRHTLDLLIPEIKPGVTLAALDRLAKKIIETNGGEPAFLGYVPEGAHKPYPATLCTSVNDVVVHGVPSSYKIKKGDVVSIDGGVRVDGWYSDAAITVVVGNATPKIRKLVAVTEEALERGILAAQAGNTIGDIGHAIGSFVKANGLHIVQGLTGHGVGTALHEDPNIFNEGKPGAGMVLQPGMVIAIEPMVAIGTGRVEQLPDDSFATADGSMSAHFEKTIAITKEGPQVLT
jgi:methionyl aminopeptidase